VKDLHALSSVCLIFRNIFPPQLPTRVRICCDSGMWEVEYLLRAFGECPSLLRDISKIDVEYRASYTLIYPPKDPLILQFRSRHFISAFLRNVPLMPRLHTATFYSINLQQRHLALLFRSNSLHRLEISQCYLPRRVFLPPSPIRHLTLSLREDCRYVEPLLGHCSPNLEVLDFNGHLSHSSGSTKNLEIMTLPDSS